MRILQISVTRSLTAIMNSILLTLLLLATSAWAGALEDLRASGGIGESSTGYVIARNSAAQAEADAINAQRKAIYQVKAKAQGVSIDQVGKVYAQEIFKTVPAGTWIQVNGNWLKK